jgi:hypothetical protein
MGTAAPSGQPSPLEKSRSDLSLAASESTLILRVAQGMVVPLRFASDVSRPVSQIPVRTRALGDKALAVPFRVSTRLTDQETGQDFGIALAIEPSVVSDRVRVALECDPLPAGGTWKVSLRDAEEELTRIPILQRWEVLDTKLPYGFYVVELSGGEHSLYRFAFTVEPFSLPEALEAADEYLAYSQYSRAVAVLEDAGVRYPNNGEVWDLLSVVEELAALDPEAIEREGEEFGVFRGPREWFKGAGTVLQKMRSKFGESVASLLVARKLEPASVPDDVLGRVTDLPVSLPALRALTVLEQHLREAGDGARRRDERLEQILTGVTGRLGQLETLTLDLGERLDAIRTEKARDVEEKFRLVGEQLVQFSKSTRSVGVSLPDFAPIFQDKLGEGCWKWIGDDTQEMFVSAEDIYRYFAGSATMRTRDFSPALIEFCRGLELLLNFRLGKLCEAIRNLISGNQVLRDFVDREVKSWAKLKETIEFKKSYTIPQVAISLRPRKDGGTTVSGTYWHKRCCASHRIWTLRPPIDLRPQLHWANLPQRQGSSISGLRTDVHYSGRSSGFAQAPLRVGRRAGGQWRILFGILQIARIYEGGSKRGGQFTLQGLVPVPGSHSQDLAHGGERRPPESGFLMD